MMLFGEELFRKGIIMLPLMTLTLLLYLPLILQCCLLIFRHEHFMFINLFPSMKNDICFLLFVQWPCGLGCLRHFLYDLRWIWDTPRHRFAPCVFHFIFSFVLFTSFHTLGSMGALRTPVGILCVSIQSSDCK